MDFKPSWWGLAGMSVVVLMSLAMNTEAPATVRNAQRISNKIATPVHFASLTAIQARPATTSQARGRITAARRMAHQTAFRSLQGAGVKWRSTGHCTDRTRPTCTSFDGIRYGTLTQTIDLKRRSQCPMVITGGTEVGHARGRYSHGNGFKVDIGHNRCINSYITRKFHYWKVRGDGASLYRPSSAATADVYADEPNHWDILFR